MNDTSKRLACVEFIRFLAALSVVIRHYVFFLGGSEQSQFRMNYPTLHAMFFAEESYGGYTGVLVFWMLSGFIFFYRYNEPIHRNHVKLGEFFLLRFTRLYPLHIATLLPVAVLQYFYLHQHGQYYVFPHQSAGTFVQHLLFISGWTRPRMFSFNAPVWSVSVEIAIYAIFFAAALAMRLDIKRSALVLLLTFVLLVTNAPGQDFYQCASLFFTGGLVWLAIKRYQKPIAQLPYGSLAALSVLVALTFGLLSILGLQGNRLVLVLTALPPLLLLCHISENLLSQSAVKIFTILGGLTYSSYLLHFPLQLVVLTALDLLGVAERPSFASIPIFSAYIMATMLLSYFSWRYFEMPTQNYLRKRWL